MITTTNSRLPADPTPLFDQLLTAAELAAEAGFAVCTVRQWARAGLVPFKRHGRRGVRFERGPALEACRKVGETRAAKVEPAKSQPAAEPKPEWWDDWSNTDHALILVHSGGQPSGYYVFPVDRDRGDWYSISGGSNLGTGFTRLKARMEHTVWTRVATITEACRLCKLPPLEESKVEAVDDPFHISRELVVVAAHNTSFWHYPPGKDGGDGTYYSKDHCGPSLYTRAYWAERVEQYGRRVVPSVAAARLAIGLDKPRPAPRPRADPDRRGPHADRSGCGRTSGGCVRRCCPGAEGGAANAARIVACVNALAGIPDPAAFVKAAEGLAEVVGSLCGSENDNLSPCYCVHAGGRIIQCDRCRLYAALAALAAFRATTTTKEPTNEA